MWNRETAVKLARKCSIQLSIELPKCLLYTDNALDLPMLWLLESRKSTKHSRLCLDGVVSLSCVCQLKLRTLGPVAHLHLVSILRGLHSQTPRAKHQRCVLY